jgi:hypothetical protein
MLVSPKLVSLGKNYVNGKSNFALTKNGRAA